jgi:hypothetical protein
MSFGKSSGVQTTVPTLSKEQNEAIQAQTGFLTKNIIPSYAEATQGATKMYNASAPGVQQAAQNLGTISKQAQETLGGTGESALRSGITGLQSLFDPNYEANQIQAAMAPAQQQYQQNVANQAAQFGGAGNLGSARQALAGQQLAGSNAAQMGALAAQIQKDTASQRMGAASQLAQLGQGGLGQALGAAGQGIQAAMTPQQLYNQYASILYGTPSGTYTPQFAGTQGSTTTSSGSKSGLAVSDIFK